MEISFVCIIKDDNYNYIITKITCFFSIAVTFIFLVENIVQEIPKQWEHFAEALNINKDKLSIIKHVDDDFHKFCCVIEEWRRSNTIPFTWEVLITVLDCIGEDCLGRELRKQRCLINVNN